MAYISGFVLDHAPHSGGSFSGGAVDAEPELAVDVAADRVVDAADHLRHLEYVLRDLGGHDVAVVALSHGDEAVGVFRSSPSQQVGFGAVTDDEAATKAVVEHSPRREAAEGARVIVDDGDVVTVVVELLGQP